MNNKKLEISTNMCIIVCILRVNLSNSRYIKVNIFGKIRDINLIKDEPNYEVMEAVECYGEY